MLVPAVRASTAWLPTVLLVDVVVLIKKGIRHLVDQGNDTPQPGFSAARRKSSTVSRFRFASFRFVSFPFVSFRFASLRFGSERCSSSRVQRVWSRHSLYPGEGQPDEREGRREVRVWQTALRSSSWSVVRRSSKKTRFTQQRCCCCLLCQNVEMVYTAVALRTLRIADVMSLPRGGGLASERFAPAPAALQSL